MLARAHHEPPNVTTKFTPMQPCHNEFND